ncbi:hypothetical protein PtB15_3B282 [Puccinia triticina]|nr:hypothetical protein PtB15_3B282 [Puccinia triticina]
MSSIIPYWGAQPARREITLLLGLSRKVEKQTSLIKQLDSFSMRGVTERNFEASAFLFLAHSSDGIHGAPVGQGKSCLDTDWSLEGLQLREERP